MKIFMYILAFTLIISIFALTRKVFNIPKSKYRLPIVICTLFLSLLGWLSLPGLMQHLLMGCTVDFIQLKTTYVTGNRTHYFYQLDSGFSVWSNTNYKVGTAICSPV